MKIIIQKIYQRLITLILFSCLIMLSTPTHAEKVTKSEIDSVVDIATEAGEKGEYEKSIIYFKKAISMAQKIYPAGDCYLAVLNTSISRSYIHANKYDSVINLLEKTIPRLKKCVAEECEGRFFFKGNCKNFWNKLVAVSYNLKGMAYYKKSKYSKSIDCLLKTHMLYLKLFGLKNISTSRNIRNLADAYKEIGDYKNALKYAKKHLEIELDLSDSNDYMLFHANYLVGELYYKSKDYKNAVQYHIDAFKISASKKLGFYVKIKKQSKTLKTKIAYSYLQIGEYKKALKYYYFLIKMKKRYFGETSIEVAGVYKNVGLCYLMIGKYLESETNLNISLKIYQKKKGNNCIEVAKVRYLLSLIYEKMYMPDKSIKNKKDALKVFRKKGIIVKKGKYNIFISK